MLLIKNYFFNERKLNIILNFRDKQIQSNAIYKRQEKEVNGPGICTKCLVSFMKKLLCICTSTFLPIHLKKKKMIKTIYYIKEGKDIKKKPLPP